MAMTDHGSVGPEHPDRKRIRTLEASLAETQKERDKFKEWLAQATTWGRDALHESLTLKSRAEQAEAEVSRLKAAIRVEPLCICVACIENKKLKAGGSEKCVDCGRPIPDVKPPLDLKGYLVCDVCAIKELEG
jgi:hypothetical protein